MNPTQAPDASVLSQIHLGGILSAVVVLAVTWFVVRLVAGSLGRLGERFIDKRLLLQQIATALRFVVWSIGLAIAVLALNLSKEVVLTLTGAAAVTIGFALKDLASSVLAGITILIDRPFQVGDRVTFGGFYGEISAIGLRSVRLVTLDDNLVTIPNNKFLTDITASGNAGALDMHIQIDFHIGVDQDLSLAKRLVEECLISNRYVYTKKPWLVAVTQVIQNDYFAYRLRAKGYVLDVKHELEFQTDVTERVHEAFARANIAPPAMLVRNDVRGAKLAAVAPAKTSRERQS
jgi:small-conductance mechanosensitive channel